jgi:hypothetical protein
MNPERKFIIVLSVVMIIFLLFFISGGYYCHLNPLEYICQSVATNSNNGSHFSWFWLLPYIK